MSTKKEVDPRADLMPEDLRSRLSSLIADLEEDTPPTTKPPVVSSNYATSGKYEEEDEDETTDMSEEYEEEPTESTPEVRSTTRERPQLSDRHQDLGLKAQRYLQNNHLQSRILLEWMADLTRDEGSEIGVQMGPFKIKLPGAKLTEENGCVSVVIPAGSSFEFEMPPGTEVVLTSKEKQISALYMIRLFSGRNLPFQILIFLVKS